MKKQILNLQKGILFLLLCTFSQHVFAQNVTVRGIVEDTKGEFLIGATVYVHETNTGTVTDVDGKFILPNIPPNATLEVSYVGMISQTFALNGRTDLHIIMEEDAELLDEVVVIGYGTTRREAVTGSVSSMGGDVLTEVPSANISQAMVGRIAGLEMTQTSSIPGAEMRIRIRGQRSLTASNDPLIVLDGTPFPGNLGDIDPNTIKSIDILKDASATAIYGSRGSNGVIIITTKTGHHEQKAKVNYNGYAGFKTAIKFPMMTGDEFLALKRIPNITYPQLSKDEKEGVNTDWQDLLLQTGYVNSHNINISGGSRSGAYNIGTGYYKDQAVLPIQNYTRINLRANIEQEVATYFRFGLITNSNYNISQGNNVGMNLTMSPLIDPYNEDGTLKTRVDMAGTIDQNWFVNTNETYKQYKDLWVNKTNSAATYNNIFAEVKAPWIDGLKFRVNVGLNFSLRQNGQYTGRGINSTSETNPSTGEIDYRLNTNWEVQNLLTFDRIFAEKHSINVTGLYSAEQITYNRTNISARDIPNDQFQYWNLGQAEGLITVSPDNQEYWQSGLMSYMGRFIYAYDNRYMLSVAFRSDGSSRLAPRYQWHTYPAVSLGWNIHREPFMNNISQINNLKLRVGYGETSNQAVAPYSTLGRLTTTPYNFDNNLETGYYVSQLPNSALGWEYSRTWNFGLDFATFNNRLTGTVEYYIQKTFDVLQNVSLPSTSGVNSYTANIGKTENKGVELTLNGIILNNPKGFTWQAGINFTFNRNKLIELASGADQDIGNRWFVGYPINSLYDYKYDGLWQEGDAYINDYQPGAKPGDIRVKYLGEHDADGRPTRIVNADDRVVTSLEPNFIGGFNTSITYKEIDLSIVGSFQNGGILIGQIYQTGPYLNNLNGRRGQVKVDYWTPENTGARFPNPAGIRSQEANMYLDAASLFDGTYLKIRTITLGYSLNKKLTQSIGLSSLRVYATAQNPFVMFSDFKKMSGLDPEPNSVPSGSLSRFAQLSVSTPNTRNYIFGLNITF